MNKTEQLEICTFIEQALKKAIFSFVLLSCFFSVFCVSSTPFGPALCFNTKTVIFCCLTNDIKMPQVHHFLLNDTTREIPPLLCGEHNSPHREDVDFSIFGITKDHEHVVTYFSISLNHLPLPKT